MDDHVRWRLELARGIGARLEGVSGIRAIVVAGSVARGSSDAYSDIEIIAYWDEPPETDAVRAIAAGLGAARRYPSHDPGHESALLIRGVPVDLWHQTVRGAEAVLDAVLVGHSIDLGASNVLDTIRTCIPLRGEGLVGGWKERVRGYPDALAVRFLEAYLPHFHLRQLGLAARRDNPTAYYHTLSDVQCSLFLILLALNRAYFPTYKWMYEALDRMPIGPIGIAPRLRRMFDEPPLRAASALRAVLAETLALAVELVPGLGAENVARARYGLGQAPTAYEAYWAPAGEGRGD